MDWRTGHITSVSEAFEAIWGESADDLYGNPAKWTESIHADDRRCVEESFLKDAPLGKFAAQYRIVRPDDSIRWIRNRGFPIRTASGEVRWVAGIAEDITESKQAIEALAHLQRKYELILNSAGEGIYGLDCNGRVSFANPAAVNMIGWTAEELIGESMHDVLHHTRADGTSYPEAECPIHAAFRDGSVHRVDAEVFWKKEGTCFPVSYTSTPIVENGGLVGAVITFRDVTEQQRSDQALRNALVEVQQLKRPAAGGERLPERGNQANQELRAHLGSQQNTEENPASSGAGGCHGYDGSDLRGNWNGQGTVCAGHSPSEHAL